jgi:L,D-peptidoglycan transpeptidase YkuD (ErfK/YbiS/YcfS/YnhG family)
MVVTRWGARFAGRRFPASVGRGGLRRDKRESDMATPVGRWAFTALYWRPDRMARPPGHARWPLPSRVIDHRQGWCERSGDPAYNRPVRLPHPAVTDRMRRGDPLYDLCVATDHNAAGAPDAGSAIFVHLRRGPGRPTAGCVAFRRADLVWILRRWKPWSRMIVVG